MGSRRERDIVSRSAACLLCAAFFLASAGCGDDVPDASSRDAVSKGLPPAAIRVEASDAEIREDETEAVRDRLLRAMNEAEPQLVADDFDVDAMLRIVFSRLNVTGSEADRFISMLEGTSLSEQNFADRFFGRAIQDLQQGGSYEFLRTRRNDARTIAVFRLRLDDGRFNYHEWEFARSADGKVRIVDFYIYATGDWFTESMARIFELGRVTEKALTQEERATAARFAEDYRHAQRLSDAGDAAELDRLIETLPENVQGEKRVLLMQVKAAWDDDAQYREKIARLAELYPDDTATVLCEFDLFSADGKHEEAIATLNRLDERVGGDPYLAVRRASEYVKLERLDDAERECESAIDRGERLYDAYSILVYVAAKRSDWKHATRWARELCEVEQAPPSELFEFDDDPMWTSLQESQEWRELLRERGE